jgi:hypothetical protein
MTNQSTNNDKRHDLRRFGLLGASSSALNVRAAFSFGAAFSLLLVTATFLSFGAVFLLDVPPSTLVPVF